jgi:hypothetical protein
VTSDLIRVNIYLAPSIFYYKHKLKESGKTYYVLATKALASKLARATYYMLKMTLIMILKKYLSGTKLKYKR